MYAKFIGGNVEGANLLISTEYSYDADTFEYKGAQTHYDGGKRADNMGYYTFDSIKAYLESKGESALVKIEKPLIS